MSLSNNYIPLKQIGNGVTTQFTTSWKPLAVSYLRVYLEAVSTGVQTLQVEGLNYNTTINPNGTATITFVSAPSSANYVVIGREVAKDQTDPYRTAKGFQGGVIENSFDKLTAISQDQDDKVNRSLKFKLGSSFANYTIDDPINGRSLKWNTASQKIENSTNDIDAVASTCTTAAATATTQAGIATTGGNTATTQANIATAAAATAQAIADSMAFRDTVFLTFANSPRALTQADNGKLFSIDTSGGNFVFNLAQISTLSLPFVFGVKKATSDTNTVTLNRGGTDTINDGITTNKIISSVGGSTFYPDVDTTPDRWTTADFGATAGEYKNQTFVGGVDYTAGVTTTLTLTNTPVSPSSAALSVFFDGVNQVPTTDWTYNPSTGVITFVGAIDLGVQRVFCSWASTALAIGTPADGSVGTNKIIDAAITFIKMAASAIATRAELIAETSSKLVTANLLKHHAGVAKAWVNFNGTGTVAIRESYNVSSITDNGVGDYTVNFTNAFSNANYVGIGVCTNDASGPTRGSGIYISPTAPTSSAFRFLTTFGADATTNGAAFDASIVCMSFYGTQP